jgi:hypothetical protein
MSPFGLNVVSRNQTNNACADIFEAFKPKDQHDISVDMAEYIA